MHVKNFSWIIIWLFMLASPSYADLTLARAPQLSPSILAKTWGPYVDYLSDNIGEKIILKLYSERAEFESDIVKGNVDFYFGNPAYAVVGKLVNKYTPLVRGDKTRLRGIIVVRKDSEINSIEDLRNKLIVFPGKTAFAASLYIQDQLENALKLPYKAAFVDNHNNAYRSVLAGKYIASGGVVRTLEREPEAIKQNLKIIYETPGVKPHVLMAHQRVSKQIQDKVIEATIRLNDTSSGKKMLKSLKLVEPVKADYDLDYKKLEKLTMKVYAHLL